MKFFKYDSDDGVTLNEESILLTREFQALLDVNRNKTASDKKGVNRELAFKEFTYIYLFFDWESVYFNLPEQERHGAAFIDSGLSDTEFENPEFKAACKKYEEVQNSSLSIRLLKGAMKSVETLIFYLEHVDVSERDPMTGKPIYKTKDLIAEIKGCKDVIVGLQDLEKQVKKDLEQSSGLRGDAEAGFYD